MPSLLRVILLLAMTTMMLSAQHVTTKDVSLISEANAASAYVPVESWVYASLDQLAAAGIIRSSFRDLRPWTRLECSRQVEEAAARVNTETEPHLVAILHSLQREFATELQGRRNVHTHAFLIESISQRSTVIAGRPLTDGFHFAETIVNDQGRPFAEGTNVYTGTAIRANFGSFAFRIEGEAQHVPLEADRSYSNEANRAIAAADFTPMAAAGPGSGFTRGRLLEANVSFAFSHNQITFGKQSLWWGPAQSGAMLFSNNAEPLTMFRYDRTEPLTLPGFLRLLGPMRFQFFVGRTGGAQFLHTNSMTFGSAGRALENQPYVHGEKISFKPTSNLEFGVSRTVLFAGQGTPLTLHTFLRSVFSASTADEQNDPGDRRNAVDAHYQIPGIHGCADTYFDAFAEDQPFPIVYPTESAWISGVAFRCVPKAPKLTLRAEGLFTPHRNREFPGFFYFNDHYLSGYTNNRQLIGSWIGREAQGEQLWATWHISAISNIELSGRHMHTSTEFLHGGSLSDIRISTDIAIHHDYILHAEDQFEQWHYPLLDVKTEHNNTLTLQLSYRPTGGVKP